MAKLKYDVTNVEETAGDKQAPVGTYILTVENVDGPKPSSQGNQMLEIRLRPTHDAKGDKLREEYAPIWYYPLIDHDHPFVQQRWREFLLAFGYKPKGTLDTDKLDGMKVLGRLKEDTDQDGDYRPRIAKLMKVEQADEEEPDADEGEEEESEPDEEAVDLESLDRKGLKAFIKDEELDIKVLKSMSDDDIRAAIVEAMGDEEEDEEEPDEDEEEEDGEEQSSNSYDSMSVAELKAELKERELPTNGARAVLVARLSKDDEGDAF